MAQVVLTVSGSHHPAVACGRILSWSPKATRILDINYARPDFVMTAAAPPTQPNHVDLYLLQGIFEPDFGDAGALSVVCCW